MKERSFMKIFLFFLVTFFNICQGKNPNIDHIISQMTLEQKIGQMMIMGYEGQSMNESMKKMIEEQAIGGFILLALINFNFPDECAQLTNDIQKTAFESPLKIPLFIAMDQEGGIASPIHYMLGGTPTPGNMALGASGRELDTFNAYKAMGLDLKACGVNVDFAPAIDVLTESGNPDYTIRSFSGSMELNHSLAKMAVRGLKESSIVACAKHFPGLAYFKEDTHKYLPIITLTNQELMNGDLSHFRGAIEGGVDMIMTVHSIYTGWDPNFPVTLSPFILNEILRKRLGYKGLIISDSMGMGSISKNYSLEEATVKAVQAGCDIILHVSNNPQEIRRRIHALVNAVNNHQISETQIDISVARILNVKAKYNLFNTSESSTNDVYESMTLEYWVKANKTAALNGIVVLRNDENILPINSQYDSILVISPPSMISRAGKDEFLPVGYTLGDLLKNKLPDLNELRIDTQPTDTEIQWALHEATEADLIIAYLLLTEFAPAQQKFIHEILALNKPTIIMGLGMPSDVRFFPEASTVVITHSPATISMEAGINVILGEAIAGGSLPFQVNNQYPQGTQSIKINEAPQ